jgi:coniferyl-aldehyde dehydrogenase
MQLAQNIGAPFSELERESAGAYHGETGFETFSHMKPLFYQTRLNGRALFEAPRSPFWQAFGRYSRSIA